MQQLIETVEVRFSILPASRSIMFFYLYIFADALISTVSFVGQMPAAQRDHFRIKMAFPRFSNAEVCNLFPITG